MAVSSGPDIVDSGLVLALDAADRNSFDSNENLTIQTSQIGVTPTYSVSGIVGLNTTATTAPNDLYEASLLDNNGNTATNYVYGGSGISLVANTTYTYSIHIKQGTKSTFWITIDENGFGGKRYYSYFTYSTETVTTGVTGNTGNDGVLVGSSATKLTNGWYRLSLTFRTSTTSVSGFVDMINRFGDSGSNYVWGRQLEYGSSASPYYATTGGIKTRGSTLIDLTGRGNTGTLTNSPTYSSANGGSIVFDGTNDYISLPTNFINWDTGNPLTISVWFKTTSTGIILGQQNNPTPNSANGYIPAIYVDINGLLRTTCFYSGFVQTSVSSSAVNNGSWNNITVTFLSGTQTSYLNGISYATLSQTQQGYTATYYYFLGSGQVSNWTSAPASPYFNGSISNFSYYNRALSATEIQQNFNSVRSRFGI